MNLHDRLTLERINRARAVPALVRECHELLVALVAAAERELRQ